MRESDSVEVKILKEYSPMTFKQTAPRSINGNINFNLSVTDRTLC